MLSFITTKPGDKYRSIKFPAMYEALRRRGYSKSRAAAISNAAAKKRGKSLPIVLKAPNYGARAGQTIGGRLVRGNDGKFASGGGAAPAKPKRKPAKTEAEREAQRQQRAAERQAARQAEQQQNIAKTFAALGLAEDAADSLARLAAGEVVDDDGGLVKMGLAEQAKDGSYRLTATGRAVMNAAERGDLGAARDAASRASDRATTAAEAAAAEAAKPVGGGGGGKKKPEKPPKLPARTTSQGAKPVGGGGGAKPPQEKPEAEPTTDPALAALAQRLSAGETLSEDEQDMLIRNGLARLVKGELVLTQAGSRIMRGKEYIARWDGKQWARPAFAVYKDARGRRRWVAYSSNAYRDRDEEIVSTKALTEDCARADAARSYGPLRWWHVPGWELGECDFNAMHGRVLVESGTFKSDAIGAAVERAAPSLQLSIGFTHAPDEPDRSGVFHHIQRFERSLVPSGRAANPFTRLIVRKTHMDAEKETAIKAMLGEEAAQHVLAGAEAVQKDADDRQTAYKSDDPWAAVLTTLKAAVATMIAPPPAPEPVAEKAVEDIPAEPEAKADVMVEEAVVEPVAVEDDPGEMTYDEFVQAIRAVVREEMAAELKAQIAPLAGMLDIEKKVGSAVQSLMAPYQAQKDDEAAQLKAQLKEAQDRLRDLEGDIPAAFRPYSGFRASEAPETVLKQAGALPPGGDDDNDPFAEIRNKLFGTTNGHA